MRLGEVRALWREPRFGQLLAARLTSQAADGVFQASLVSAVVFDPTRRTGATQVAVGFVVLLLPYSVLGPYVGVFLDRWHRQRVLERGAAVHGLLVAAAAALLAVEGPTGVGFACLALAALSVNRLYLSAQSASLPRVVARERLVVANSLSPTAGTLVTILGGLLGLAIRAGVGRNATGDAVVAGVASAGYVAAALVARRIPLAALGPGHRDLTPILHRLSDVSRGLVAGFRHLRSRPLAGQALLLIAGQRLLYGLWTIMTVLLYRNAFHDEGVLRSGLTGLGQVVAAGGVGLFAAALVTPRLAGRLGPRRTAVAMTLLGALGGAALQAPVTMASQLGSALVLGFATQATKICVDTLVQREVAGDVLGRVFAIYDTLFNGSFVAAALLAAACLPADGRSAGAVAVMAVVGLALALWFATASSARRLNRRRASPQPAP